MNKREKELVIKWYDMFVNKKMTEKDATDFIIECGDADVAERVMRFIAIRHRYLDI